jgi:Fic family protein
MELEYLIQRFQELTKDVIDFEKYTYYASTHHSTSIEGSTLTESQVINLLEYGKTAQNKPFEHHQMVVDYFQAIQFVVSEAAQKRTLSASLLHQSLARMM